MKFWGHGALLAIGLAGCTTVTEQMGGLGRQSADAVTAMPALRGQVTFAAPEGYCIDRRASNPGQGFGLMADCAQIAGSDDETLVRLGLITVQVGEAGSASIEGNEQALTQLLQTSAGRATLALDGDAESLTDISVSSENNLVIAEFEDLSDQKIDGTTGTQWRGFFDLGNRITTVTVYSLTNQDLRGNDGNALLREAINALIESNRSR